LRENVPSESYWGHNSSNGRVGRKEWKLRRVMPQIGLNVVRGEGVEEGHHAVVRLRKEDISMLHWQKEASIHESEKGRGAGSSGGYVGLR